MLLGRRPAPAPSEGAPARTERSCFTGDVGGDIRGQEGTWLPAAQQEESGGGVLARRLAQESLRLGQPVPKLPQIPEDGFPWGQVGPVARRSPRLEAGSSCRAAPASPEDVSACTKIAGCARFSRPRKTPKAIAAGATAHDGGGGTGQTGQERCGKFLNIG